MQKIYKKHLDLFQEVKPKQATKLAYQAFDLNLPGNMLLDFDFENRVVIMKNKNT